MAAAAVFAAAFAPAFASDKTDVMAVIDKAVADFNKGDKSAWAASCTDQASIVDGIAPYRWDGAGACSAWWDAFAAGSKKDGMTDGALKIAAVRHVEVTGGSAYVVLTADFSYTHKGKPAAEKGSSFVLVLTKAAPGWRIASWAWADK